LDKSKKGSRTNEDAAAKDRQRSGYGQLAVLLAVQSDV
jgi:hypothetical protein